MLLPCSPVDSTQRFETNNGLVCREEDDGAFLFDPDSGNLKYVNATGKAIFLVLNEQKEIGQAVDHLLALFPSIDRHKIEKDVEAFVGELQEQGFVSRQKG